jgi:hypothetical protein
MYERLSDVDIHFHDGWNKVLADCSDADLQILFEAQSFWMVSDGRLYVCLAFLDVQKASVGRFLNSFFASSTFFGSRSRSQSSSHFTYSLGNCRFSGWCSRNVYWVCMALQKQSKSMGFFAFQGYAEA